MKSFRVTLFLLGMTLLACSFALAQNDPTSPSSIVVESTDTFDSNNYALQSLEAIAGNITSLTIHAIGQTKSWQGYYGNITATITLDDANNFTFYNWSATEPRGQIYATLNTSISWGDVDCFNFTNLTSANESTMEAYYNIAVDDADGVGETYTATDHPSFDVVNKTITGCPTSYIFQSDTAQTENFANVLLYDSSINETGWVYTTLIENKTAGSGNDLPCYNGEECDFQILVNEDGHGTDLATTTYYFWVELL
ncbi:MAG: hypothetical protein OXR66_07295 [Candidatus Woesearchaeota archaeon]|nr:hypothetical protein [Candidatus Woesearchaeota archaeon]